MELQQTLRGENFLAFDSGSDDPDRFLLFTTEENLDILEVNTVWHADGTFKSCPSLFYQIYTVHAVMNGHTIPLVYFLLQRKTEDQYVKALNQLKQQNPCLEPSEVVVDFEKAPINAFLTVFPKVQVRGCFFHFAQANWRKVQELGLAQLYNTDTRARLFIKSFVALALIPPSDVPLALEKLCASLDLTSPLCQCVEYFEDVWIGRRTKPQFEVSLWSQFSNAASGSQKTNNSVEGWHRAFQLTMGCAHPNLHKFINFMRREQSHTENRVARIRAGEKVEKKVKYVKIQERIQEILRNYQNNRILKELEGLSHNFHF